MYSLHTFCFKKKKKKPFIQILSNSMRLQSSFISAAQNLNTSHFIAFGTRKAHTVGQQREKTSNLQRRGVREEKSANCRRKVTNY